MASRRRTNPSVDAFRQMPLFDGCHRSELERIGRVADEALLPPGFHLARQGDLPLDCFLLAEGQAEVTVDGTVVGTVSAPALIGARSLREGNRRTASVVTTGSARVFSLVYAGQRQLMTLPLVAERLLADGEQLPECMVSPGTARAQARPSARLLTAH